MHGECSGRCVFRNEHFLNIFFKKFFHLTFLMAATGGTGKRQWRRWDDVEERLLAAGVKTYGTKQWERVQQHMGTDRTVKQLSDHWVDRQEQCKELLERLGPAPRPNRPSVAAAYMDKAAGEAAAAGKGKPGAPDKKLKGQAALLTRVPSLRHTFSKVPHIYREFL